MTHLPKTPRALPYSVVGHRGWPQNYPENTLIGLVAAAQLGAPCVELDVQMSRDGVPMVFHDAELARVTGREGKIWEFDAITLAGFSAHEGQRLGEQYLPTPISTLAEVASALAGFRCQVFVEIKKESMQPFARELILERVAEAIAPIRQQAFIISFDYDVLRLAKGAWRIGWVLSDMQQKTLLKAQLLQPDVLAYDVKKLTPEAELWPGPWHWFLWDIVDPVLADHWYRRGVTYIETWDAARLLSLQ